MYLFIRFKILLSKIILYNSSTINEIFILEENKVKKNIIYDGRFYARFRIAN